MKIQLRPIRAVVLLAVIAAQGCAGYSHYFRMPPGAENVRTVAITIFRNKTLYMDLEHEFMVAFQREICARTRLTIADKDAADALMTGSIESYTKAVRRGDETDAVSKYAVTVTVSCKFSTLASHGESAKVISPTRKATGSAEYEVQTNITEAHARAEAVRKAARNAVSLMFEPW